MNTHYKTQTEHLWYLLNRALNAPTEPKYWHYKSQFDKYLEKLYRRKLFQSQQNFKQCRDH